MENTIELARALEPVNQFYSQFSTLHHFILSSEINLAFSDPRGDKESMSAVNWTASNPQMQQGSLETLDLSDRYFIFNRFFWVVWYTNDYIIFDWGLRSVYYSGPFPPKDLFHRIHGVFLEDKCHPQVPSTKHFYHPQPVVWRLTLPWRNACAVVFSPATMRQAGFGGVLFKASWGRWKQFSIIYRDMSMRFKQNPETQAASVPFDLGRIKGPDNK